MSMTTIGIEEIQRDFLGYLNRVAAGESFRILQANRPVAEIIPVEHPGVKPKRPAALCLGEFTVPDNFDDPLPEDILRDFEGI
jgi:prevent-host-death family protein